MVNNPELKRITNRHIGRLITSLEGVIDLPHITKEEIKRKFWDMAEDIQQAGRDGKITLQ